MKRPARERCAADGSRLAMDRRRARQSPPENIHTVNASRRRRVYFSETTVMRGGTSSALISGYSTFLRLRSEGRCCWRGRSEVFGIWHAAGARREARDDEKEGGEASVSGRRFGREERVPADASRTSAVDAGSLSNPRVSEVPSRRLLLGASAPVFRFQGFGGLSGGDAPSWAWFWCGPWWPWG